jgi:hypothetical protein
MPESLGARFPQLRALAPLNCVATADSLSPETTLRRHETCRPTTFTRRRAAR